MKTSLLFLFFLIPILSPAQRDDLWHTIERESPTLRAARAKLQAGRAAGDAQVRWDDPEAEVAHFAGSPKGTPPRTDVSVSQSLDWGMLTGRRRKVAQAADSLAWGDYVLSRYDLHCQARRLMVEAVFLNRFCAELSRRAETASLICQHAERRKSLGEATSQEVSKARLQVLMAQTELKRQEARRRDVLAQLSQLAGGAEAHFRDTTYALAALPSFAVVERAAAVHPALLKAQREVKLAESEHRLSKVLNRPTFSVGFAGEYTRDTRYSGVSLGVTIPLWGKGRAESRSRRLAAEAVRSDMEATATRLRGDVKRTWEEARALWETAEALTAERFRSEGVAKVRRAYEEGQLSLTDCLLEVTFYDSAVTAQLEAERDAQLAASDLAVLLSEI
ncbi:MAG: TolC family protein [Alloprevotella sp.]